MVTDFMNGFKFNRKKKMRMHKDNFFDMENLGDVLADSITTKRRKR